MSSSPRAVVLHDCLGPYHQARLAAAAEVCDVVALEVRGRSLEYDWTAEREEDGYAHVTLEESGQVQEKHVSELEVRVRAVLDEAKARVVFIPGWSSRAALAALGWGVERKVPVVVMSESTEGDGRRNWRKEWVKRRIVACCSCALVGGGPQTEYMHRLGMARERIFLGYDAVDNGYFERGAAGARNQRAEIRRRYGLPQDYFLASARFIAKKNLTGLLEAYARYRFLAAERLARGSRARCLHAGTGPLAPWELVLLGDGPLRPRLEVQVSRLGLRRHVYLPGFIQYSDLPAHYGLARAFVHASTTEQWGLVVNEAMACRLPVAVSNRCGCAADLVREGVNGFTFDPYDVEGLARLMVKLTALDADLAAMGRQSERIIANWGLGRFAAGLKAAMEKAVELGSRRGGVVGRALIRVLVWRGES